VKSKAYKSLRAKNAYKVVNEVR